MLPENWQFSLRHCFVFGDDAIHLSGHFLTTCWNYGLSTKGFSEPNIFTLIARVIHNYICIIYIYIYLSYDQRSGACGICSSTDGRALLRSFLGRSLRRSHGFSGCGLSSVSWSLNVSGEGLLHDCYMTATWFCHMLLLGCEIVELFWFSECLMSSTKSHLSSRGSIPKSRSTPNHSDPFNAFSDGGNEGTTRKQFRLTAFELCSSLLDFEALGQATAGRGDACCRRGFVKSSSAQNMAFFASNEPCSHRILHPPSSPLFCPWYCHFDACCLQCSRSAPFP